MAQNLPPAMCEGGGRIMPPWKGMEKGGGAGGMDMGGMVFGGIPPIMGPTETEHNHSKDAPKMRFFNSVRCNDLKGGSPCNFHL